MSSVTCADCRGSVSVEHAELSPNGWRCRTCSLRHQIDVHRGADDQIGEISIDRMQRKASKAMGLAVLSIVVSLVCIVLLAMGILSESGRPTRAWGAAFLAIPGGIVAAWYELVVWRKARRATAVMRGRESSDS
jgi:hypothetical protein